MKKLFFLIASSSLIAFGAPAQALRVQVADAAGTNYNFDIFLERKLTFSDVIIKIALPPALPAGATLGGDIDLRLFDNGGLTVVRTFNIGPDAADGTGDIGNFDLNGAIDANGYTNRLRVDGVPPPPPPPPPPHAVPAPFGILGLTIAFRYARRLRSLCINLPR